VTVPSSLNNVDLVTQASDAELLSFLSYDSQYYWPQIKYVDDLIEMDQIATLSVSEKLTAANVIETDDILEYIAGDFIELSQDFEVTLGAQFDAYIDISL